jgi:hypothetical protein
MNMTPDLQKKVAAVAGFALLAAGILYFELPHNSAAPSPAAPVVTTAPATSAPAVGAAGGAGAKKGVVIAIPPGNAVGNAAKNLGTTSAQLDPTLRMEAMLVTESVVYSGSGRNIFSANSMPVDIPKPIMPVRTGKAPMGPPPPPPGPPPPPPIDLKFFGTATSANGTRRAFLLHGEDVFLASDGDIVQRRYKVITVSANSIVVEDMSYNDRQTLPLLAR